MEKRFKPEDYPNSWNFLLPGTVIDDYIIERRLGGGGFSSVYLARQRSDQFQVAIKEYLPRRLAHRTWGNRIVPNDETTRPLYLRGRQLFLEEAKVLAKLKHPNIVEVLNFFQANSTVYLVMTYDYGKTLDVHVKGKNAREDFLMAAFPALLDGLLLMHRQGLLHLDIKPQNILIRPRENPLLLDFGATQPYPYDARAKKGNVLTNGFSPIEQYADDGRLGPWSDIYSVGASMRMCLDGAHPPAATERVSQDKLVPVAKTLKRKYSPRLLEAVDAAMSMDIGQRPQSVEEMLSALQAG